MTSGTGTDLLNDHASCSNRSELAVSESHAKTLGTGVCADAARDLMIANLYLNSTLLVNHARKLRLEFTYPLALEEKRRKLTRILSNQMALTQVKR